MQKVYVVVSRLMNNFDILHQGIVVGDHQFFFHRDPKVSVINGVPYYNFDYMITDGSLEIGGMKAEKILPKEMYRYHPRHSKLEQGLRMNQFMAKHPNHGYIPVQCWMNRLTDNGDGLVNPKGKVVIKPKDGARGIGQYLVDTDKVPLAQVIDALDRYVGARIDKEDLIKRLDKYGEGIVYSTAGENWPEEGLSCLRDQGYVIQSYVEGIESEYRILTGSHGEIAYCQRRTIKDTGNGYAQATGSDTDSLKGDDIVNIDAVLKPGCLKMLERLLKEVVGPVSSVDLFVKSPDEWGIFEYCNQFGMKGVPHEVALGIHVDYLRNLVGDPTESPSPEEQAAAQWVMTELQASAG